MHAGDLVFRKGKSLQWGRLVALRSLWDVSGHQTSVPTHADVDWYAPRRRGGRGFHRSCLKLTQLVLVTEEETVRREAITGLRRDRAMVVNDTCGAYRICG